MKITIHGFTNYTPTDIEWEKLMNSNLVGAEQDCCATISGITRTLLVWQGVWHRLGSIDFYELFS